MPAMCVIKELSIRLMSYSRTLLLVFGLVFARDPKTFHISIKRVIGLLQAYGQRIFDSRRSAEGPPKPGMRLPHRSRHEACVSCNGKLDM